MHWPARGYVLAAMSGAMSASIDIRNTKMQQNLVRADLPAGLLFDQPRLGPVPPWGTGRMVTVQEELSDGEVIRNTFDVASVEFGHL